MALLGVHNTIVRDALTAEGGHEVKHTGDGIMASFVSAAAAVRCATRIQRALAKHRKEHLEHPLKVRIGAAAGESVEREHDLFGATVQLAARLCSHAQPDQILVSGVVAELCLGKGLSFEDLGDVFLRALEIRRFGRRRSDRFAINIARPPSQPWAGKCSLRLPFSAAAPASHFIPCQRSCESHPLKIV